MRSSFSDTPADLAARLGRRGRFSLDAQGHLVVSRPVRLARSGLTALVTAATPGALDRKIADYAEALLVADMGAR